MTSFSAISPPPFVAPRQRDAERLEDRGQDVLRVVALDQADVDREPRGLRELIEERRREIGLRGRLRAST